MVTAYLYLRPYLYLCLYLYLCFTIHTVVLAFAVQFGLPIYFCPNQHHGICPLYCISHNLTLYLSQAR